MRHNLFTPINGPLNYPFFIQVKKGGIVDAVVRPENTVKVGDTICSEGNGESGVQFGELRLVDILEERQSRGQHSVDFKPVFQKIKTSQL